MSLQVENARRISSAREAIDFLLELERINRNSLKRVMLDCPASMAKVGTMEMVASVSRFVFKIVAVREKDLVICDDFNSPKNSLSHTKKSCNSSSETKIFAYFWGKEKYS